MALRGQPPRRQDAKGEKRMVEEPEERIDELAHTTIGAAIDVHRTLGPGYLEGVYEEALAVELKLRGVPAERQRRFAVDYKGVCVGEGRIDLLVDGLLVVELKTVDCLLPIHKAQALSYLKALDLGLALLINFKVPVLRDGLQRVVRSS
jgi:GxxExxY protein